MRTTQAEAVRAGAEAAAHATNDRLVAAQRRAKAMLGELDEAVGALRADQERSRRQLMSYGKTEDRYSGIIGAMVGTVREVEPARSWWRQPTTRERSCFAGWWVRYRSTAWAPFEFEVPLRGEPLVGEYFNHQSTPKKWTFADFADGGLYEYTVGGEESGPRETREITADEAFRDFLKVVQEHLLLVSE